ncbi:MAG: methyltransferase domain-containing protein [Deltaproteobacteria bacterium]|nr:methyltransferase domain-containing protein [Deltaproteobacteria bacterium]
MISKNSTHIKQRIKQQFSSSAQNYDSKAGFQKKIAEELLNYIVPQLADCNLQLATILDIGCGTGFLTIPLAETFSNVKVYAIDIAHPMVKTARLKTRESQFFLTADCDSLPYKNCQFDLLASSLTYQWSGNLDTAFKEAHRILEKGGMFAFSMLGQKTFKELRECYKEASHISNKNGLPPFMNFHSEDNVISKLKKTGFSGTSCLVDLKIEHYPNMLELLRTLKTIGAGNPFDSRDKNLGKGQILKKMAEIYQKKFKSLSHDSHLTSHGCIYATYEVMFFTARK